MKKPSVRGSVQPHRHWHQVPKKKEVLSQLSLQGNLHLLWRKACRDVLRPKWMLLRCQFWTPSLTRLLSHLNPKRPQGAPSLIPVSFRAVGFTRFSFRAAGLKSCIKGGFLAINLQLFPVVCAVMFLDWKEYRPNRTNSFVLVLFIKDLRLL